MSLASILLWALLASVASASENPRPLVEHSIRVDGHVKCGGVPLENATVNLVFVVPNPDKDVNSDELTGYNEPVSSPDALDYTSIESDYPSNNSSTLFLPDGEQPGSSIDNVIGNSSETGEVPSGYDYPDNDTDLASLDLDRTDLVPAGQGASLVSKENGSVNVVGGSEDYYMADPYVPSSEFEDVMDSTWTSAKGAYHVEGKILYAPGDYTWRLHLKIEHRCDNGTISDQIPYNYISKQDISVYEISSQGKKQFHVDVEVNANEAEDSEYKTGVNTDY